LHGLDDCTALMIARAFDEVATMAQHDEWSERVKDRANP
jgi:hypothetical protein